MGKRGPHREVLECNGQGGLAKGFVRLTCGHVVYSKAVNRTTCWRCGEAAGAEPTQTEKDAIEAADALSRDEAAQREFPAFNGLEASDGQ